MLCISCHLQNIFCLGVLSGQTPTLGKRSFQPEHGCWDFFYQHGGGHMLIFTSKPFVDKQFLSMWCGLQSVPAPGFGSSVRSLNRDSFQCKFFSHLEKVAIYLYTLLLLFHEVFPGINSLMYTWVSSANQRTKQLRVSCLAEFSPLHQPHDSGNKQTQKNINTFVHNKLSVSGQICIYYLKFQLICNWKVPGMLFAMTVLLMQEIIEIRIHCCDSQQNYKNTT